jgi:hypothetical protein
MLRPLPLMCPCVSVCARSGGVKLGYTGFVPHSRRHFGSPHKGGVDGPDGAHCTSPTAMRLAASQEGARGQNLHDGSNMGSLMLPSMIEEQQGIRPVEKAPMMRTDGGAILGYGGHRPKHTFEDMKGRPSSAPYRGSPMVAQQTPHRRYHADLGIKVGTKPGDVHNWVPGARRAITPPPSWRDAEKGAGGAAGQTDEFLAKSTKMKGIVVNDWRVHQAEPPPSLPPSSRSYKQAVGGILPGWQGFVPHSAAHCGSSHVGLRSGGASPERRADDARAQRGHVGKSGGGALFRQHDDNSTSTFAAGAVIGYSGHIPSALHAFGVSAFANPDRFAGEASGATFVGDMYSA